MNKHTITAAEAAMRSIGARAVQISTPWGLASVWLLHNEEWGCDKDVSRMAAKMGLDCAYTSYGPRHPDFDPELDAPSSTPRPKARSVGPRPTEYPEYYHPLFGECEYFWQSACDAAGEEWT